MLLEHEKEELLNNLKQDKITLEYRYLELLEENTKFLNHPGWPSKRRKMLRENAYRARTKYAEIKDKIYEYPTELCREFDKTSWVYVISAWEKEIEDKHNITTGYM